MENIELICRVEISVGPWPYCIKKKPQRAKAGNDCHSLIKVVELKGKDGASEG